MCVRAELSHATKRDQFILCQVTTNALVYAHSAAINNCTCAQALCRNSWKELKIMANLLTYFPPSLRQDLISIADSSKYRIMDRLHTRLHIYSHRHCSLQRWTSILTDETALSWLRCCATSENGNEMTWSLFRSTRESQSFLPKGTLFQPNLQRRITEGQKEFFFVIKKIVLVLAW